MATTATGDLTFANRNFLRFLVSRLFGTITMQVLSVAVGYQLYSLLHDPMVLGYVGLAQFLPMLLLVLPAGDLADRVDRRLIIAFSFVVQGAAGAILFALTLSGQTAIWPFYTALVLFGTGRAFTGPAQQSFVALMVNRDVLPKALAWDYSTFQTAIIGGPALGGLIYLFGPVVCYGFCCLLFLGVGVNVLGITLRHKPAPVVAGSTAFERVKEGITFIRSRPIILGALSLDLFAVLLGGVTALLPIFAKDILAVGPTGFGLLRSAPAVGAVLMGLLLARVPLKRYAGLTMFGCVALFGLATVVFAVSTTLALSLGALFVLGASDTVSVYVRSTLVQLTTPDHMRGRVSAVNQVFISSSNELGEFESGFTAAWMGPVTAAVVGGLGTLVIVALWMGFFPPLRKVDRLSDVAEE